MEPPQETGSKLFTYQFRALPKTTAMNTMSRGFSLLELIVVLAGLGILSSLAIPNYIKLLDANQFDEIKALLNTAAADCLQKSRSEDDPTVDDEIISDAIIEKIGYKIDRDNSILNSNDDPKCKMLWLEPTSGDKNEEVRYNIGFSLSNGILDKLASTEVPDKKPDCIKWAGECKFSKAAKILEEYKEKIRDAKKACDSQFEDWKENKNMNPSRFQQWDSSKGPDTCPKSPPDDENDTSYQNTTTCTTQGCDLDVWGLWDKDTGTGTVHQSRTNYEAARKLLIGEKCDKQIKDEYENSNPPFTNPSSAGVPLSECQNEAYWFIEGENKGSEEEWKKGMCDKNKQDLLSTTHSGPVEHCDISPIYIIGGEEVFPNGSREDAKAEFEKRLAENKDAQCTQALNNDAAGKKGGPFTSPTPPNMSAPIGEDCNIKYWYCEDKIYREETEYNEDERCKNKSEDCASLRRYPACDQERYFRIPACRPYNECMGRI